MASDKRQKKVRTVMREFKEGKLKSSSGQKVTNPKQAIAIGLSEAGLSKQRKKEGGPMKDMKMKGMKKDMADDMPKMKYGGKVKKMASGGSACSYKSEADGVAKKGRTKPKMPKMMRKGGKAC